MGGIFERVAAARTGHEGRIPRRPKASAPLSSAQARMRFLDEIGVGSSMWCVHRHLRLRGELDTRALEGALHDLQERHEILRTRFVIRGEEPVQEPGALDIELSHHDLRAVDDQEDRRAALLRAHARPFDLERGPLWRVELLRFGARDHELWITLHHIISDGASMAILARDLGELYSARVEGRRPSLRALRIQFGDYAVWESAYRESAALVERTEAWCHRLRDMTNVELPLDHRPPSERVHSASTVRFEIDASVADRVRALCDGEETTLFVGLLAAFQAWLARYSGPDVAVGTPVANRFHPEVRDLIGLFVNTIVLRTDLSGATSFREVLRRVRTVAREGLADQTVPFDRVIAALRPALPLGTSPFNVMFALYNDRPRDEPMRMTALTVEPIMEAPAETPFDLSLSLLPRSAGTIDAVLTYDAELFEASTAERFARELSRLLAAASLEPSRALASIDLLDHHDRAHLRAWSAPEEAPAAETVDRGFAAMVRCAPASLAVTDGETSFTYAELDRRSDQIASWLVRCGVRREDRVAVWMERSAEWIAVVVAIAKCGGAYLPLDPAEPAPRVAAVVAQARPALLLGTGRRAALACTCVDLDDPAVRAEIEREAGGAPLPALDPALLAYVIFTSGTTGVPKGVAIEHGQLAAFVAEHVRNVNLTARDRVSQMSSPAFDASISEIWPTLVRGASLHLIDDDLRVALPELATWMAREKITLAGMPTAMAEEALALAWPGHAPRLITTGGAALRRGPPVGASFGLVNSYGPTETTVYVTTERVDSGDRDKVTIGRPLRGCQAYVVGPDGALVPPGVFGELWIGGAQLGRGYLADPRLTADRFRPNPFGAGRIYRTGDRVRWCTDGRLEFDGRIDDQVKLRGFRIELGEIEAAVRGSADVAAAAVVLREDTPGNPQLVVYVVPARRLDAEALRTRLHAALPGYMLPSAIVELDALPLLPSGKLDRKALPAPLRSSMVAYAAPRDPIEAALAQIWCELLGVERVGLHDDFFALGGHSLLATRMAAHVRSVLGAELPVREIFASPTLAPLAAKIADARAARPSGAPALASAPRDTPLPLSFAQQRLWFLQQLAPESTAYHLTSIRRFDDGLEVDALRHALEGILHRHEALRASFPVTDGEPRVELRPAERCELPVEDLRGVEPAGIEEVLAKEHARPFDLARGPLVRARLLRVGETAYLCVLTLHHIVTDGWSMGILWDELGELYAARVDARAAELRPLPIQYTDYAIWQRAWLTDDVLSEQLAYWTERLRDAPSETALPFKGPRPPAAIRGSQRVSVALDAALVTKLHALARREGATLFILLLAGFRALLARYTGQHDLVIGTPVANRSQREVEGLIGFFVNTLALRSDVRADDRFTTVLAKERQNALAAYDHQDTPIERILDALDLERRLDLNPLFQVWFVHQNVPDSVRAFGEPFRAQSDHVGASKFDLALYSVEAEEELRFAWFYNADLFDSSTIERMISHYHALLSEIAEHPDLRVDELLSTEDGVRNLAVEHPLRVERDRTIWERFSEQAQRYADRDAIVERDRRWTYRELAARAGAIGVRVRALGATRVALLFGHGAEMIAAMLGVLGAGATYVPLDPGHPPARLREILADSRPTVLLVDAEHRELARALSSPGSRLSIVALDEIEPARLDGVHGSPDEVAYLLYTSGSTGRPKGVIQRQRGVLHHALTYAHNLGIGPGDRLTLLPTYAFDAAVMDIFGALLVGAALYPWSLRTLGFDQLGAWIARERVTVLHATPTVFRELVGETNDPHAFGSIRAVVLGGEAVVAEDFELYRRRFPADSVLLNGLGPTECTLALQNFLRPTSDLGGRCAVPVGYPVAPTTRVWLETPLGRQLAPFGVGELVIESPHVALGYWNRPSETEHAFRVGADGVRQYRTGDIGRLLPDGRIEYVGRGDSQIKIHGVRIELGEIEAILASCPGVAACAVTVQGTASEARIVACVAKAPSHAGLEAVELSAQLATRLPPYMVPAAIAFLPALPRTATGKIDRRALPAVELSVPSRDRFVAPRTVEEIALAEIWRELLRVDRIDVEDNFFALGGSSLTALRLVSRVRARLGAELPVRSVFEHGQLAAMAALVARAPSTEHGQVVHYARTDVTTARASVAHQYFYYLDRDDHDPTSYYAPLVLELTGPLDEALFARAYDELVASQTGYRTGYREIDGVLHQVVLDRGDDRPPSLEVVDRTGEVGELQAELAGAQAELAAADYDLATGRGIIRARLIRTAPEHHALMILRHHIASDGDEGAALAKHMFEGYARLHAGADSALPDEPPLQLIDVVHARQQWETTTAGRAQRERWMHTLEGAVAVELEGDAPRAPIDARRDAAPLGITADASYPPWTLALPDDAYAAVLAAAKEAQTTTYVVFAAGLAWLLRERSHQDDIALQTSYSPRAEDPLLAAVHGCLTQWSLMRLDLRGAASFNDAILCAKRFAEEMLDEGPPRDYYAMVPHGLRRVVFNYLPISSGGSRTAPSAAGVTMTRTRWPFPPWKRPWDLHLTLTDSSKSALLVWTGFSQLFRRETVEALLARYVEILRGQP